MLKILTTICLTIALSGCSITTYKHAYEPEVVYRTITYTHYHPVKKIRIYKKKKRVVRKLRRAYSNKYYWYTR